ncbi:MAG: hypothetical protein ACRCZI_07950 [Cetobacterium sp.]
MDKIELEKFSEKYFKGELKDYLIKEIEHGSTYFYNKEYVKVLHFRKHKFKNLLSKYIYKENSQLRNLKKVSRLCQELKITIYSITEMMSVKKHDFNYGIYSAEKVNGITYHELEKSVEIYKEAFVQYVKMLKHGIYEYDFGAHNFLVTENKNLVFIDFDESVVKAPNNKLLYKSLALLAKNFKRECIQYGLDWETYKNEALNIIERDLGIKRGTVENRIKLLTSYRTFMKSFRNMKRKLRGNFNDKKDK